MITPCYRVVFRTTEAIQQKTSEQLSPLPTSISLSPFKTSQKSQKKGEEKKTEPMLPELSLVPALRISDKVKGELIELNPGRRYINPELLILPVRKPSFPNVMVTDHELYSFKQSLLCRIGVISSASFLFLLTNPSPPLLVSMLPIVSLMPFFLLHSSFASPRAR